MPQQSQERQRNRRNTSIFINAPYGSAHEELFLAYIVGVASLGLTPRAAIETYDSSTSRLERIADLLRLCRFSIHDLSAIGVDAQVGLPRFNMPLELGMAIQEQYRGTGPNRHRWLLFDAEPYRTDRSTSDLRGFEALSHGGTADGVLRGILGNLQAEVPVTFPEMSRLLSDVKAGLPRLYADTGTSDIFSPGIFHRVVSLTAELRQ